MLRPGRLLDPPHLSRCLSVERSCVEKELQRDSLDVHQLDLRQKEDNAVLKPFGSGSRGYRPFLEWTEEE